MRRVRALLLALVVAIATSGCAMTPAERCVAGEIGGLVATVAGAPTIGALGAAAACAGLDP